MIKSIQFIKKNKSTSYDKAGYLYKQEWKPTLRKGMNMDDFERELNEKDSSEKRFRSYRSHTAMVYKKYFKDVYQGYKNKIAHQALIGKVYTFQPNINILFGPNGSGKSTILKTLANGCLCGVNDKIDGWSNVKKFEPMNFGFCNVKYDITKCVTNISGNPFQMNWDGVPVFYLDINHLLSNNSIDGFQYGTVNSTGDALSFTIERNSNSSGQVICKIFDLMVGKINSPKTVDTMLSELKELRKKSMNQTWRDLYDAVDKYYNDYLADDQGPLTLLLDEPDRSLDISKSYTFWYEFLPAVRKHFNCQIIVATHNPFVLSKGIMENDDYNLITLDKKYTKEIKEKLSKIQF